MVKLKETKNLKNYQNQRTEKIKIKIVRHNNWRCHYWRTWKRLEDLCKRKLEKGEFRSRTCNHPDNIMIKNSEYWDSELTFCHYIKFKLTIWFVSSLGTYNNYYKYRIIITTINITTNDTVILISISLFTQLTTRIIGKSNTTIITLKSVKFLFVQQWNVNGMNIQVDWSGFEICRK